MCAISGIINTDVNLLGKVEIIKKMTDIQINRGPDDSGYTFSEHALLGHRRLVVVDKEGGKQPMSLVFKGKIYTIVYNGELYNTEDIRIKLLKKGHKFKSYSDTEVLLHAFAEFGEDVVKILNGIFAFAVWEEVDKTLFLCRDIGGVKPLFYADVNGFLVFSSEIKGILQSTLIKPKLDKQGLKELFILSPSRVPGSAIINGINELERGCYITYKNKKIDKVKYHTLVKKQHTDDFQTTVQKVGDLVTDSIKRQLVSDVPLCFFLSGGLDSSTICSVASREYEKQGKGRISTYSVDYVDNDKYFQGGNYQPTSDNKYIDLMSKYINSKHTNVVINSLQLNEALCEATIARDLPGMADIDVSLYLLCKEVKKDFTVALSGECADEIFGGYPWYYRDDLYTNDSFPWLKSTNDRLSIVNEEIILTDDGFTKSLVGDMTDDDCKRKMMELNLDWFMATLLNRKDRMSMATSLEVRVPFCDYRIIEYLYNVPFEMKHYDGYEKGLLRHGVKGYLPDEVLWRKKSPYPKTYNPMYKKIIGDRLTSILSNNNSKILPLINKKQVEKLINTDNSSPWFGQLMTNPQIMAWLVQMEIWLNHNKISIDL